MRDLILQALRESVKRYPDIKDYLNPDTLLVYWLGSVKIGEAPDDDIRRKDERRLERALVKFLEKQKARVLTYIRTHDMKGVQPSFWEDEISKLWDELGEDFVGIIMHGVNGGISLLPGGGTGLGIDEDKINMSLVQWGRKYRDKWLAKVEETSRQYVEEKISAWALSGDPLSTLIKSLDADTGGMFSKARARRIAVTEVTRLHAMGNKLAWEEAGTVKEWRWNTANDELVCPICRPNNGKPFPLSELDGRIPAHVNCRCWASPVVDEEMFGDEIDRILGGGGGTMPQIELAGQDITNEEMISIIKQHTNINPEYTDIRIMSEDDFIEYLKSIGETIGMEGVAGINKDGIITVKIGYEDSVMHELIHSAGFHHYNSLGQLIVDPRINEGMTQSFTEYLADKLGMKVTSGYTEEVDYVNDYVIPLTGMDKEDFFKSYAQAENKHDFIAQKIWDNYGDKFTEEAGWGANVMERFMQNAGNSVRGDIYVEYLVDELNVLNNKSIKRYIGEKIKEIMVDGKLVRIIYITDYRKG